MTQEQLDKIAILPPANLIIVGPYDKLRETFIGLSNPNTFLVAFHIRNTKQLVVKPKYGYIRAKGETFIKVFAPPTESKTVSTKERIKVWLGAVPKELPQSPKDVWSKESAPKVKSCTKLRVEFRLPDPTSSTCDSDSESEVASDQEKEDDKSKTSQSK